MNDTDIRDGVLARLNAWSGFRWLQFVMRKQRDVQVYLMGGAVRRVLLGDNRPVKDFDFFLDGPRLDEFVARIGQAGVVQRTPFGSPRWYPPPTAAPYADFIHASRFFNGLEECRNVRDALGQIDCTINAVAFDLRSETVLDLHQGRRDARRRVMRVQRFDMPARPIRPGMTLTHAGLLWLRTVHYARLLGLRIEPRTRAWLRAHRPSPAEIGQFTEIFFAPRL